MGSLRGGASPSLSLSVLCILHFMSHSVHSRPAQKWPYHCRFWKIIDAELKTAPYKHANTESNSHGKVSVAHNPKSCRKLEVVENLFSVCQVHVRPSVHYLIHRL